MLTFPTQFTVLAILVIDTTACRTANRVRGNKRSGGKSQLQPPLSTVMSVDLLNKEFSSFCQTFGAS